MKSNWLYIIRSEQKQKSGKRSHYKYKNLRITFVTPHCALSFTHKSSCSWKIEFYITSCCRKESYWRDWRNIKDTINGLIIINKTIVKLMIIRECYLKQVWVSRQLNALSDSFQVCNPQRLHDLGVLYPWFSRVFKSLLCILGHLCLPRV